jgi:SPP1 gp7 family putative phage head morphogenesis protein
MSMIERFSDWMWGSHAPVIAKGVPDPAPLATPAAPQPARHEPQWAGPRSVSSSRWATTLTPQKLATYLRQASDGDPQAQAELLTEMEDRDLHLVGTLGVRKRAVAGLPWGIAPASERRQDKKIAEYCTGAVKGIAGFRDALVGALDAIPKGYSGTEIDWRSAPGRVWVNALYPRPARWFVPDVERPQVWRILSESNPSRGDELVPAAWIWHEAKAKAGSHAAETGLGRPLAWAYLFKSFTLKDWVIFAELYGAPLRIGKYPAGTSEPDRIALLSQLKALGVDAAAVFPDDVVVELKEAQKSGSIDVYAKLIEWCERAQSKAILGQTLTTEEGRSGSRALGQVHDQVRQDLLEADAEQLSETITRQLIQPLVDFQFGPQPAYPTFALDAKPPADLKAKGDLYVSVGRLGVQFPRSHIHTTFGIPEPKPGEPVYTLGAAAPKPDSGGEPGAEAAAAAEHIHAFSDTPLPPIPAELERVVQEALQRGGYAGWESILRSLEDYVGQATSVGDVSARLVQACEHLHLEGMAEHLADELLRADLIGRVQVRQGETPMGEWPSVPPREAIAFWRERTAVTAGEYAKLSQTQRSRAFSVAQFTTLQAVQQIHGVHETALAEGWTLAEFDDAYRATLRSHGMEPDSPWHIENVFRTNILTAANVGRWNEQARPETRARRPYLRYDAVDDGRTRPTHAAMDDAVYPADHPIWQAWYPPNGYQCRCGVYSLTGEELLSLGLRIQEELPTIVRTRPDGARTKEPNVPDEGFRSNPALEPHQLDFSAFPPQYRAALGV